MLLSNSIQVYKCQNKYTKCKKAEMENKMEYTEPDQLYMYLLYMYQLYMYLLYMYLLLLSKTASFFWQHDILGL